jgi:glycosyltransferase involved in cell wall biosynthesis
LIGGIASAHNFASPEGTPPLRVLQIVPELETGGAELTTVDVAQALVDSGHEAFVVSQGGRMVADLPEAATHITLPVASKNPLTMLANARRITGLCQRERIDLIHARSRAPAWSGLMAARSAKIPFVTTYHGAYQASNAAKRWYNSVMARGDVVIANSQFTADSIASQYPFARDTLTVIPRGTDFAQYNGNAEPYDWPVPESARVVVQIARLTEWKGQSVAVGALAGLPEDVHLVLAGDDQGRTDYRESLIRLADRAEVAHRVHLVGHVDAPRALAWADVCIVPSTQPEAFGRAAVEAQAAGVPVVVSKLGAVPETVLVPPRVAEEARTGWHVKPGDPMALCNGIREALALEGEARDAHIKRAKEHVHARFSLDAMCQATLAVYRQLVP